MRDTNPDSGLKRTVSYFLWCIPVSIVFFAVYPLLNAITHERETLYSMWVSAELSIPFVPEFIWVYCSFYLIILLPVLFVPRREHCQLALSFILVTLIGGLIFLLLPGQMGYVRELPPDPVYRAMYSMLFELDEPHNLVPSLHVAWSCVAVTAVIRHTGKALTALFIVWLALIMLSTLLVHQHHVADVISGFLLAVTVSYAMRKFG